MNEDIMRRKHTRRITRSKEKFPTTAGKNAGGSGEMAAKKDIEGQLGHSIDHWKASHTPTQWAWKKPYGVCSDKSKEQPDG